MTVTSRDNPTPKDGAKLTLGTGGNERALPR